MSLGTRNPHVLLYISNKVTYGVVAPPLKAVQPARIFVFVICCICPHYSQFRLYIPCKLGFLTEKSQNLLYIPCKLGFLTAGTS